MVQIQKKKTRRGGRVGGWVNPMGFAAERSSHMKIG
jgi:hypothetical protein